MYWKKIKMKIYGMTFCGIHVSHTKSGRTIIRLICTYKKKSRLTENVLIT